MTICSPFGYLYNSLCIKMYCTVIFQNVVAGNDKPHTWPDKLYLQSSDFHNWQDLVLLEPIIHCIHSCHWRNFLKTLTTLCTLISSWLHEFNFMCLANLCTFSLWILKKGVFLWKGRDFCGVRSGAEKGPLLGRTFTGIWHYKRESNQTLKMARRLFKVNLYYLV